MHAAAMEWIQAHATADTVRVLDVGGRQINGTPRALFPNATEYVVVDLVEHPSVDLVADVLALQPGRRSRASRAAVKASSMGTFDVVVYAEVAEHSADWQQHLQVMMQLLNADGRLIITAANQHRVPHSSVDGGALRDDEYYENLTRADLMDALLAVTDDYQVDEHGDDIRAVAYKGADTDG